MGITFKNTSQLTWGMTQGYALAVLRDPNGLFGGFQRVQFGGPNVIIQPNANATFQPLLTLPNEPGVYQTSIRMIQEFVEFFGPVVEFTITVIDRPNATSEWTNCE